MNLRKGKRSEEKEKGKEGPTPKVTRPGCACF